MVGPASPVETADMVAGNAVVYAVLSPKYDSSAVIRLRRSDFWVARYAFSFVFANFGIAIAARMPMITTTISNSISVKPLRAEVFMSALVRGGRALCREAVGEAGAGFREAAPNLSRHL